MKTKLTSLMIILCIVMTFAAIAQAAPAGKVTNLDGRVDLTVAGKPAKALSIGDVINVGDIIRTKSAAKCEVTFVDGSIIRLAENSRLKVTEYNLGQTSRTTILSLFRGKVQNVVTATTKLFGEKGGSKYEVHTPTSVCGVRGTTFYSYHQNGVSGALFSEGSGYIYSKGQPGAVKSIAPGQMMVVTSANKPPESKPASQGDMNKFFKDTTPSEKKKDTKKDGDDKDKGGGGTSGSSSNGSGSSGASGSSSGSGSGDSSTGSTGGSGSGDSTTGSTGGSGSGSGSGDSITGSTGGSGSGGSTGGTSLGGDPTFSGSGPAIGGSIPGSTPTGPTPTNPTPTVTIPPVIIPTTETTETFSTFTQAVTLGAISGTMTGSIGDTTNTGTLSLNGTGAATTSASPLTGTLSDGSTYNAYIAGVPGSWSGLFTGLTYKGGMASILQGSLSDPNYTDSGSTSVLAASGTITRGAGYSVGTEVPDIYSGTLPVPVYFTSGSSTYSGQGYEKSTGGLLAVWALSRTGGLGNFPTETGSYSLYYTEFCPTTPYAYLGQSTQIFNAGTGHFQINSDYIYFMTDKYFGTMSMNTQGVLTSSDGYGHYYYNEIAAGTYNLDPLKYNGYWGTPYGASLYYNNSGTMTLAGEELALIGGTTQAPWTGNTDFKAIGEYYYNAGSGGYTYYLWNTPMNGYDPSYTDVSSGGYFEGITAGIWGSSKKGSIRAIYVTPVDGNGSSTAGILTSDDISVGLYSEIGMWIGQGTLGPYSGLTYTGDPTNWGINYGTAQTMKLKGAFNGNVYSSITGSGLLGTEFLVDNSASPSWGVYNLILSGASNAFSGKPSTGDTAWSAKLGGQGQFGYDASASTGYWIADINNGGWTEDGQITGNVSGYYLTPTYKGTIVSSPFYGVNSSSGGWIGESVGIYTGTPLTLYNSVNMELDYAVPQNTWSIGGNLDGIMGGTRASWWNNGTPVYLMGKTIYTTSNPTYATWSHISSYNSLTSLYTTYDGGAYTGYVGVVADRDKGTMAGKVLTLYIGADQSAGYLQGNIAGSLYSGIDMWSAEGNLTPTKIVDNIGTAPENINSILGYGGMNWNTGNQPIGVKWTYGCNTGLNTPDNTAIGIYHYVVGGTNTAPSPTWEAKVGGPFTYYSQESYHQGQWVADINNGTWSGGTISGNLQGRLITTNLTGSITGDFPGTYNADNTWQAISMGIWSGTPLAFSGSVDKGTCGYFDLDPLSETYNTFVPGDPSGLLLTGIIGSTTSFIGASAPLSGIGTYYAASTYPLWEMSISKNLNATSVNSLSLWFGGIKDTTSFKGKMIGLYANWNGTNYDVGYLTSGPVSSSAVTGNLYSGIGMWEITSGELTSEANGTPLTSPGITVTSNPRIGSIAGTGGISGVSNGYDMYFTADDTWGVWRSENGGTYTGTPAVGWSGVAGEAVLISALPDNYSISHITGVDWANGQIAGTTSGRFLSMDGWGRTSGDILGVYDSTAKTWQTLSLGKIERTETLAFASVLTGNLYQVVPGTVFNTEYKRPYWNNAWFDPLRYETNYFVPTGGTYNATTAIAFESARKNGGSFVYKDEYHYFPNGKWVLIQKGLGVTHAAGTGNTSELSPVPDFTTTPPTTLTTHFDSADYSSNINPGVTTFDYTDYVKSFYSEWATNALVQNGAFTGILGGLNNVSLWSSDSGSKTNIILMGTHDAYNGSQIFGTSMSYSSASNGAFIGGLTGIIQDTDATTAYSANPLTGLIIGLYVDPSGNAGVLKGNFTGTSYTGINMWESTDAAGAATLYRYSTKASGLDPTTLASNIFLGNIGSGVNSAMYGTFGGNGSIYSPLGIMGRTYSITNQPSWGIFTMQIGLANTYENPTSATSWTSTLFGSAMFGQYPASYGSGIYADLGFWYADVTTGTWAGGKLTGNLNGEFITHKKVGTLEGSLLGTYDGTTSGTWQATSTGTYVKTQDVLFSSEIWGNSYRMVTAKTGSKIDGYNTYNYWYNNDPTSSNNYGDSTYYYYDSGSYTYKKVITRFDIQGPPGAEKAHKDVWVQGYGADYTWNTADDTYTFATTVYDTLAAYNAAMADLQKDPSDVTGNTIITPTDQLNYNYSNFNGIMAGTEDLWTNIGNHSSTPIYLMGDIDKFDNNNSRQLFSGTIVSFNPLVNLNPYSNSTAPIGGAYYAYLGGASGTQTVAYDTLDGMISGLYLKPDGSAGVLYGTITGNNLTDSGYWKGTGTISGYKLLTSATGGLTSANFASNLVISSSYGYTGTSDSFFGGTPYTQAYAITESAFLSPAYGGYFGVYNFIAGGTYNKNIVTHESFMSTLSDNSSATYSSNHWDSTTTNNVRSGSVLHNGVFDPATATGHLGVKANYVEGMTTIQGGDLKGLFNPNNTVPAASTWQVASNGTIIETSAFVTLVNSLDTAAKKEAFMSAMKIPCVNVGSVDLTGTRYTMTGNSMSVNMSGVNFYAYSTGQAPRIFATNNVSGNYDVSTLSGAIPAAVTLTASNMTNLSGVTATFTPTTNFTTSKWGAQVAGAATMTTPSTTIVFKGGAAGTSTGGTSGTFSGTAAGIVK